MKKVYLHRAKTQIARIDTIRNINRQIILNYVRDRAPISRAEIAKQTTLNRSTVSAIIEVLHAEGIIEEIGTGHSSGGRKPTLLRLKMDDPVALGIDVTPCTTTVAAADLGGRIIEREEFETIADMNAMTELLIHKVSKYSAQFGKSRFEIGITVPGVTNLPTGQIHYVPHFDWRDWEISRILKKETGLSVTVENDANAIALAELWFGGRKIREIKNFITVLVAEGIGTGVIFDGQIYRGEKGGAGEFGHMIVGADAPVRCSCGGRECWEALASEKSALARYRRIAGAKSNGKVLNMNDLVEAALTGEKHAVRALRETARFLGIGIANLIVGLSPQAVVISGTISRAWKIIADELKPYAERSVRHEMATARLMCSTLGGNPTLMGAITLVLARKFASA